MTNTISTTPAGGGPAGGPAGGGPATVSGLRLAYALFGGTFAWLTHLIALSALNGWVCATGRLWPMHAVTVVTLAGALHALWVSAAIARGSARPADVRAARFLGFAATAINVFGVVMIAAEWLPVVFVPACAVG